MIEFQLALANEYDEVMDEIFGHLLSLCSPDVSQEARHSGYEPTFFGGLFPAAAAFEAPFEEFPKRGDASPLPGIVRVNFRHYIPSVYVREGETYDASPRSGAMREGMRLHARWRENLYDRSAFNTTMDGRVMAIVPERGESGDMNRLGMAIATDQDTSTILWVHHVDVRIEL